jgi:hypothetical protein
VRDIRGIQGFSSSPTNAFLPASICTKVHIGPKIAHSQISQSCGGTAASRNKSTLCATLKYL